MVQRLTADQVPRELLLLADPDWQQVQTYLASSTSYGVRRDGQVVGVVVVSALTDGHREIMNLAVAPSYQHQGLAKALLADVIKSCQQDPACHELQIGTGNSSLRQLAIYQQVGFEMVAIWQNFFVDNYPEPIYEQGIQCKSMVRLALAVD